MTAAKRFYGQARAEARDGQFAVHLDGEPAKTREGRRLMLPTAGLAAAVAAEWNAQEKSVDFTAMPMTRLAMSAIDCGERDAAAWRRSILSYLESDLLCYRAAEPASLRERQGRVWDPLLAWAAQFGVKLRTTVGIAFVEQPAASLDAAKNLLSAEQPPALLGAKIAAEMTGSAIVAMALARRAFPAEELFAAARLDENFQAERWGRDAEAAARADRLRDELMAVARFLALLRAP